ncbi:hypothetical protein RND71_020650 [Anisodus tanguticus]|uniref:DUF4283 domain-containing protein n=1 Tax=Anisodus tanguticus TaxID=243964 RepID=A0AAE1VC56_9SOLA|nr:hypothetical protein RND71_020650 [Anisodus tanguticus]
MDFIPRTIPTLLWRVYPFLFGGGDGSPIAIDAATLNKTRPSCARVKVEFDLLKSHPPHVVIQVGEGDGITTELQKIRYDFKPKYCTNCKLQGHDVDGCWNLKPALRPEKAKDSDGGKVATAKATEVEIGKGKASIPTPSSSNPSQQNPIPTTNALIHAPSNNWTTVTRKNKKNKNQNPKPPSKVTWTDGWPPPEVTQPPATIPQPVTYSQIVTNTHNACGGNGLAENSLGRNPSPSIPQKPISYLHGEPTIRFTNQEVASMVEQQDLKYAVVGKFSHGMPSIAFLRTAIPKQCSLKAEVNIGLLHNRHVLIRCSIEEDYVTLMSRPNFWIKENPKSFLMRTFKWDIGFTPEEETSMAVIWLSFPNLPPNFYVPSILFSIASAVGRPIAIDAATLNKTRPSCARVKVEADLLQEQPQRYNIQIMNGEEMETMSYKIRYDFLPKYCTTCMLQGHDLQGCWKEHPELQPEKRNHGEDSVAAAAKGKATNPTRPPTNPSRQNPNPKPLPTAPNHSQEWTTVTHKRKKQNTQIQPLELMEKDTPTTETAAEVVLDVGNIASSSKQPILNQILTEIGLLPTETVIPASVPIGKTTSSNHPISVETPTGNPTGNYLSLPEMGLNPNTAQQNPSPIPAERRFSACHLPTLSVQIPANLAVIDTGWPPPEVTQPPATIPQPVTYSQIVTNTHNACGGNGLAENSLGRNPSPSIPQKPISYLHGEPTIRFTNQEVASMVEQQDLKYAVVGKFSHGMPSIAFLRTAIPKQCSLKAEVNIGLLHNRHVLIRCSIEEDYVTLMSRPNFWIKENSKSFLMRTFKWDIWFTPEEETSKAVIWLSFPNLPPNFYVPSILFSIASAVGRPIAIDAATLNKTRPSCARVKVEADLLQEHPQKYNIQIMNGEEMETISYKIRYDFLPKYCTTCMLQGHDLQGCWKEHRNCNRKRGITVKMQWWRRQKVRLLTLLYPLQTLAVKTLTQNRYLRLQTTPRNGPP